jgi:hypothetical protein
VVSASELLSTTKISERKKQGDLDVPNSSPVKTRRNNDSDVEFGEGEPVSESADDEEAGADFTDIDLPVDTPPRPKVRPFERVHVPPRVMPSSLDGTMDPLRYKSAGPKCLACGEIHHPGACPLKKAGVEHCPLCGLAHFGKRRACPHFQSPTQLHRMLEALSKSSEDPKLVTKATKYLRGILTSEAQRVRLKAAKAAGAVQPSGSRTASPVQAPRMGSFVPTRVPQQGLPASAQRPREAPAYIDLTDPDPPVDVPSNDAY